MLLVGVGSDSSVIDNVFGVLSFFPFPLVDVFLNNKPCQKWMGLLRVRT